MKYRKLIVTYNSDLEKVLPISELKTNSFKSKFHISVSNLFKWSRTGTVPVRRYKVLVRRDIRPQAAASTRFCTTLYYFSGIFDSRDSKLLQWKHCLQHWRRVLEVLREIRIYKLSRQYAIRHLCQPQVNGVKWVVGPAIRLHQK